METVKRRQHGSTYKGHTVPYGTLVGASDELKKVYYTHGYLRDEDMPELPQPLTEDRTCVTPEEELHKKEMVNVIGEMLEGLTPREAKVLYLRFGIGLTQDYTLEEVGTRFDVTRERIRQIESKALRKMKHPQRSDVLRQLLGVYESTAQKEAEAKKLRAQWQRARENARLREEEAKAYAEAKRKRDRQELERVYQEDKQLREKWEEIKPMVSDADWVAHLEKANPAMYQELKYMVGDIWGKNAKIVWDMHTRRRV